MASKVSICVWVLFTLIIFILIFNFCLYFEPKANESNYDPSTTCANVVWKQGDPVLFDLRTKLQVNYDAGHWFHMAENFMVQHSILRKLGLLTDASEIYLNFDTEGFLNQLNGVTRLMLYLAVNNIRSKVSLMHFVHIPGLSQLKFVPGSEVLIHPSMCLDYQSIDLGRSNQLKERFVTRLLSTSSISNETVINPVKTHESHRNLLPHHKYIRSLTTHKVVNNFSIDSKPSHNHRCVKYIASIGGTWPTPQRGHWFPNEGDISTFRQKIRDACPADPHMVISYMPYTYPTPFITNVPPYMQQLTTTAKKNKYKLLIYQRDLSRKIENQDETIRLLSDMLSEVSKDRLTNEWEIKILMHSNRRSPCELSHELYNVDVLLTPHGFQSMLLIFLPLHSIIFEVFPYRYYKRGYGPFGSEYELVHGGSMSPATTWHHHEILKFITTATCMEYKMCRNYARNQNVRFTKNAVNALRVVIQKQMDRQITVQDMDLLY